MKNFTFVIKIDAEGENLEEAYQEALDKLIYSGMDHSQYIQTGVEIEEE